MRVNGSVISSFQISRLVIHSIPAPLKTGGAGTPAVPEWAEAPSNLDAGLRAYFKTKLVSTIDRSVEAVVDERVFNPTHDVMMAFFDNPNPTDDEFVALSLEVGKRLNSVQGAKNSNGLLLVMHGPSSVGDLLVIMKLEWERAIQVRMGNINGKQAFDLKQLKNLTMSDKARVFKAAAFVRNGSTIKDIVGSVSDNQNTASSKRDVAMFFMREFLGCKPAEDPAETTRKYFHMIQEYINTYVKDPVRKADVHTALMADMNSSNMQVDPKGFMQTHLQAGEAQELVKVMKVAKFDTRPFVKDTRLISKLTRRVLYTTKRGIMISGPQDDMSDLTEVKKTPDGGGSVTVHDPLARIVGK